MKEANVSFSTKELCKTFEVPISSYYYEPVGIRQIDQKIITSITEIAKMSNNTYGKRRIRAELKSLGYRIGISKTKRLMSVAQVSVVIPRKHHYYPEVGHEHRYAADLLKRNFTPDKRNTHWVGDITYIRTYQGWSYLACVMDLKTKEIVGHEMSISPTAGLVKQALLQAIKRQSPDTANLMFHSDQGTQYAAKEFRDCLALHAITQSMSRRGNCWDNAVMERFFCSLKTESLNQVTFINHHAVVQQVQQYIRFYNYKRRHSSIGYLTPHQFASQLKYVA